MEAKRVCSGLGLIKTRLALAFKPLSCSFTCPPTFTHPHPYPPSFTPVSVLSGNLRKKKKDKRETPPVPGSAATWPDRTDSDLTSHSHYLSSQKDYTRLTQLGCCVTASINIHLPRHPSNFLVFLLVLLFFFPLPTPKQKTTTTSIDRKRSRSSLTTTSQSLRPRPSRPTSCRQGSSRCFSRSC